MLNCGTKFVPVTIIIKVSKQFYSMVNSGTKLSQWQEYQRTLFYTAWSSVVPN